MSFFNSPVGFLACPSYYSLSWLYLIYCVERTFKRLLGVSISVKEGNFFSFHCLINHSIRSSFTLCAYLRQGSSHIHGKDLVELKSHHETRVSVINSCEMVSTMVLVDIIVVGAYVLCSRHNKNALKKESLVE